MILRNGAKAAFQGGYFGGYVRKYQAG